MGFTSKDKEISYEELLNVVEKHGQDKHVKDHYSKNVEPTIDGMLGGLAYVHPGEVEWSVNFLMQLKREKVIKTTSVLDVGAGIGRVSHYTLHPVFEAVDMLEQCQKYIDESTRNFAKDSIR